MGAAGSSSSNSAQALQEADGDNAPRRRGAAAFVRTGGTVAPSSPGANHRKDSVTTTYSHHSSQDDLHEEVQDLERTFNSLGISEGKRNGSTTSTVSEGSRVRIRRMKFNDEDDDAEDEADVDDSDSGIRPPNRRMSSWSEGRRPPERKTNNTGRSVIKFSWDGGDARKNSEEEWAEYKTAPIEGFDPEKFKKANKGNEESGIEIKLNNHVPKTLSSHEVSEMHPNVPSYDLSEQQLLASIEREYVF